MKKVNADIEILRKNGLHITESRKVILALFLKREGALTHGDIEKHTSSIFDRVTVYRTLQTFVEKGIVHLVPTTDNTVIYALCRHNCIEGHHYDNHVHFICSHCNKTTCLNDTDIPEVKLPKGFKPLHTAMVISGICKMCRVAT